jgi:thiamine biosynthesis lipoprotein
METPPGRSRHRHICRPERADRQAGAAERGCRDRRRPVRDTGHQPTGGLHISDIRRIVIVPRDHFVGRDDGSDIDVTFVVSGFFRVHDILTFVRREDQHPYDELEIARRSKIMSTTIAPHPTMTPTTPRLFRAMGCQVEVQLVHDAGPDADHAVGLALAAAEARFWLYESELSRFLDTSDLAVLNRAAGCGPVLVSPTLCAVTEDALAAARATDGMFDPTLGTVLAHLGYDRPFPLVSPFVDEAVPALVPPHCAGAWRDIVVDAAACTIALPAGVALDLGGIGKGWTVDRVVRQLQGVRGVRGGLVNAGGDLRVWGAAPEDAPEWIVGVEDPQDLDRDCATLAVRDRAVATSSIAFRRWKRGEHWIHHVLDPRTGRSAVTDLAAVTVVGPSAMWAEVHAKVALLSGLDAGRVYLEAQTGYEGLCLTIGGAQHGTAGIGGCLR